MAERDIVGRKELNLEEDKLGILLFKLALPAIIAQVINVLYNIVDRMYIGHIPEIGSLALTGVGITMPLIMAISAFAALVSMGGAPRAAIMMGQNDNKEAEKIMGNCFTMLILLSCLLTFLIYVFGEPILLMFGASHQTLPYALDYMSIYALGTIFVQLTLGLNAFINTQGYAKTGMVTISIGAIINIILDPIFIYTFNLGVKGAALATVISQGASSFWVVCFLLGKQSKLKLRMRYMKLNLKIVGPCILLGMSPFIMMFTESILSICFNTSLLKYGGDIAVGSMTILAAVMQFSMLPLQGLTQGAQPIISYNFGANNIERVKTLFRLLLKCAIIYAVVVWIIAVFFSGLFIYIFTNNEPLIKFTQWSMRIYMAASFMFGIQIACQQTFIAIGNAKYSIFLALLRKVFLLIPFIYIFPRFIEDKVFAVFLAEPVADFIAVLTTIFLFGISYRKLDEYRVRFIDS